MPFEIQGGIVRPERVNLIPDPSFEGGVGTWSVLSFAGDWSVTTPLERSEAWSADDDGGRASAHLKLTKGATGTASIMLVYSPAGTAGMPVVQGENYVVEMVANVVDPSAQGLNFQVFWYDAGGSTLSSSVVSGASYNGAGEMRPRGLMKPPAGAVYAAVVVEIFSATSGDVFEGYFDVVRFERLAPAFGRRGVLQDDFAADPDGPLTIANTGQPYDTDQFIASPGARLSVVGGKMSTTAVSGAVRSYAQVYMNGSDVRRIGAKFTIAPGTDNAQVALLAGDHLDNPSDLSNLDLAIHWASTSVGWAFAAVYGGVIFTERAANYSTALTKDGTTVYEIEILALDDGTLTLHLPDGQFETVSSPGILNMPMGPWAIFEQTATDIAVDTRFGFTEVWADSTMVDVGAYFDGDSPGAHWAGTPYASASILPAKASPASFRTVEQDSVDDVAQCVYVILATERGSRIEDPDFGITDPTFEVGGMDLGEALLQIETWEPRADVTIEEDVVDLTYDVVAEVRG